MRGMVESQGQKELRLILVITALWISLYLSLSLSPSHHAAMHLKPSYDVSS